MEFDWDDTKDRVNRKKHGVGFDAVSKMDWATALRFLDQRKEYGETRYLALGYIEHRLYACVYTERQGHYRIISLRKANRRERDVYEDETFDE